MRAEDLTLSLGGRWHRNYGTALCPAHDDCNPSLSIADGDDGRLLLYCHAGCSYDAIKCALTGRSDFSATAEPIEPRRRADHARTALEPLIARLWQQSRPSAGTKVETYLQDRAISGPLPDSLRFHPNLRHPSGRRLPAMLARVDSVAGSLIALHRTYLDPASPTKAAVEPSKAMLGPCKGGAVRLRNQGNVLVVCEGIETGLSLCASLDDNHAVWAALSTSGVAGLSLPAVTSKRSALLIAADGDIAGRHAAHALAGRASTLGWTIELVTAPDGRDFNDLAQEANHG